jgi:hypothetical protein
MIILIIGTSNAGKTTFLNSLKLHYKKINVVDPDEIFRQLQDKFNLPNKDIKLMTINEVYQSVKKIFIVDPKAIICIPDISIKYIAIFRDKDAYLITTIFFYTSIKKLIYNCTNRPISEGRRPLDGIINSIKELYLINEEKNNSILTIQYEDLIKAEEKIFNAEVNHYKINMKGHKYKMPVYKSQAQKYAKMLGIPLNNDPVYLTPRYNNYDYVINSSQSFDKIIADINALFV